MIETEYSTVLANTVNDVIPAALEFVIVCLCCKLYS